MGYIIAIAGKGGVGKTTVSALLIRFLRENNKGNILAVDADPNSNLGELLGLKQDADLGRMIDDISKNPQKIPAGVSKDQYIEYKIETLLNEEKGFDLLTMGKPEGPGCYCAINNTLRMLLAKLIKGYEYIIIDNEAGMEHLSRKTTRSADCFLLISDATAVGLKTAKKIYRLACELGLAIKDTYLLVNRLEDKNFLDDIKKEVLGLGIKDIFSLPLDSQFQDIGLHGKSIFQLNDSSEALVTFRGVTKKLCQ